MEHKDTFDMIRVYLAEQIEIDESMITMESDLFGDLGMDSIDALDMIAELEKRTQITFEDQDMESFSTVGDIVVFVDEYLSHETIA